MRRWTMGLLILGLVFVLRVEVLGNPYGPRILDGFPNKAFVYEECIVEESPVLEIKAVIPQIGGSFDQKWEAGVNENIKERVHDFIGKLREWAQEADPGRPPYVGQVEYEVMLNKGGLLSLTLTFYQYTGGAHGMTYLESINLDLTTGLCLPFKDVLGSPTQRERLVSVINSRIAQEPQWFFIEEFSEEMLWDNQGFYLTEEGVVVYFDLYEIAPYAAGIPKFVVPVH